MPRRINGYYWIKPKYNDWIIAYSYHGLFKYHNDNHGTEWRSDHELENLDDKRLVHDELCINNEVMIVFKDSVLLDKYKDMSDEDKNKLLVELAKLFNRIT